MKIRNLIKRVFMGLLLAGLVLLAIYSDPFIYYLLINLIIFISVTELFMMQRDKLKSGFYFLTIVFSLFMPAYFYFDTLWSRLPLETVILIILILFSFRAVMYKSSIQDRIQRLKISLFAFLLVAFFFSYQVNIRLYHGGSERATDALVYYFAVIVLGDSMAYLIGSTIGKHKLAPEISPKKTIEGSIASLAGNTLAAIASKIIFLDFISLGGAILGAIIIGIASQAGDLLESVFKRGANVKDSSGLLLGHGGVLDRIDSLILSTPVFYMILELIRQI